MFQGSIVAIVTPMTASGEIDLPAFESLLGWHIDNGTDGIVVLGTTGESPTISNEERLKLTKTAVAIVAKQKPVIVGSGANSTAHTLELTQQALDCGADAALLVTPYYNRPTQQGLYQHFKTVAENVAIDQILYNVPSRTGCDLLPETVARLDGISNIVAVKEATGKIDRVSELQSRGVQMTLLSGDDSSALAFMKAGGQGVISVAANVAPQQLHDLCYAALQGNFEKASALDNELKELYKVLSLESNPIPVKYALQRMGKISNGIRLPLTWLSNELQAQVDEVVGNCCGLSDQVRQ